MRVLIKGMRMPETCCYCPFSINDYKDVVMPSCILVGEDMSTYEYRHGKHEDCPLVEVPTPHGRLIDADALIAAFKEMGLGENSLIERLFAEGVRLVIDQAQTVIEAEEG